jgi:hypothetical protein
VQNEHRQSYGIIYKSLALFLILYVPVLYTHEIGHALACVLEGGQVTTLGVSWIGEGYSSCILPESNNPFLYHMSGGAFASALVATLLILWRIIPNYVKIVSITFAASQGINALAESFAYDSYINDPTMRSIVFSVITFALFTGLMFLYIRQISIQGNSSNSETKIHELCSKCNNINSADSSFCNKCGFALK